jgi:retron-type reverse transcriptase
MTLTRSAGDAARGKKTKPRVALFLRDLENEVIELEEELLTKTYRPRPYRTFKVHDPKERMICAADFRDRVVHHAVCSVLEPIFERSFISDTYACRKDKGTLRAVKHAQLFCRRYRYFLKLDVHKFFDSVDHDILKAQLRRKVRDEDLLRLLDVFIDHPVPWTETGKGIPIGNLTSQHFANFYLSGLDHFIKEYLRIEGYIRYMDDQVLFADEKDTLWDAAERIKRYLQKKLRLIIKTNSVLLAPVSQGLPFLGFRIFPSVMRICRQGWRRFRKKVTRRDSQLFTDKIGYQAWQRSVASLVGHTQQVNTRNLRASFFFNRQLTTNNGHN